ncbi:MAG TPA: D-Ala-D-Ala carboxypeptidase family metallohydrolase [Candidatus Brocadiales bacterium]|nr:D-Ala-D-Ala carboxypeptidase family metallohydrolase [Candidatus Brocadiales bacterium]
MKLRLIHALLFCFIVLISLSKPTGAQTTTDSAHTTALNMPLTKNITARDWQSQDNARYMRAGYAVLAVIESLMKSYNATKHNLRPVGAGYRTRTRNGSVGGSPGSHHMDGVAADFRLEISESERADKCVILWSADFLIGGKGEVLAERTEDGIAKTTVHVAIPGKNNKDYQDHAQWKTPLCN